MATQVKELESMKAKEPTYTPSMATQVRELENPKVQGIALEHKIVPQTAKFGAISEEPSSTTRAEEPSSAPFLLQTALQQPESKPHSRPVGSANGALPTFAEAAWAKKIEAAQQSEQGMPSFSDCDLLSSVPDTQLELDDLDHLYGEGFSAARASDYKQRQAAEKEFNLDDTRRRTPLLISAPPLNQDAAAPVAWRNPSSGGAPALVMEGTAPRAKMKSRRPRDSDTSIASSVR
jgi:hypothetical protein